MSTKLLRLLLAATAAMVALVIPAAMASANTVPSSTPTTAVSSVTPTTAVRSTPPPNPDEGLQPEDVFDWLKDNVVLVIVVVGLVLLVGLWKLVSRPPTTKF